VKSILIAVLVVIAAASLCYAQGDASVKKATEPVGAVIETAGVFVGRISSVVEQSLGGGKEKGFVTVSDETGKTRMFPVDETVKVVDATFNALTLNQLKQGEKVSVKYSGEKASEINVVK